MKSKILRFLSCLLVLSFFGGMPSVNAQTDPALLFAKGIGNEFGYGADLYVMGIKIDASGNRYVTGYFSATADFDPSAGIATLTSTGNTDIFLAKYDASGNYLWANHMGGTVTDQGISLALDGSGNVVVTGSFYSTADFDPGAGIANLTSAGGTDIFLAKYDASGNYVWAERMGGTGADVGTSLALDGSGNVVVTGYFNGTTAIDFNPGAGIANLTGAGITDIFLAKYDASGNYVWAKSIGGSGDDRGLYLALDGSGNVVVTGYFNGTTAIDFDPGTGIVNLTGAGGTDIFLAKYDASGNYTWAERMGGTGADQGNSLALDGSGNVVVTGSYTGTVDFDPGIGTVSLTNAGSTDIFLAKYSSSGVYTWAEHMGGTSADVGNSLALDGSTNVVVTGYFTGTVDFDPGASTTNLVAGSTFKNGFISSYTAAAGSFNSALLLGKNPAGSNVISNAIVKDGSGNLYVTGSFEGTVDFDPGTGTANLVSAGTTDIFIAKYDASGNYIWAKAMGGTLAEVGNSIAVDGSGKVVVTGYFFGTADFDPGAGTVNLVTFSTTLSSIFIAKYDASGNYLWANKIGETGSNAGTSLAVDGSGNVVVTGYTINPGTIDFDPGPGTANLTPAGGPDMFLAKYDASGNYVWAKSFGSIGYDRGTSLAVDGSGNVVVTGLFQNTVDFDPSANIANLVSAGNEDIFLAKYDASGNYVWANHMGGTGTDVGNSLALDGSGNVVVTGNFTGTADFDPGAGTVNLVNPGGLSDIFIAKYDASGNYVWAKRIGSATNSEFGLSIALDGSGNVVITGYFSGTVDFDPSTCTANIVGSASQTSIYLAKYDVSGNYVWAKVIGPGSGNDQGNSLIVDGSGNVVVTGYFNSTKDFDIGAGTYNLTSMSGGQYGFIAAYTSPNSSCINPTAGGTIAAAQTGYNPFTPAAFTSSVAASGQTGTIEYMWQSSTTSNSAGFTDIASSNSDTYTPGALTQTTWFKRLARVTCKCDWIGAAESNVLEVTVAPCINPTAGGTIAAAQSGYNPFTPAAFTSSVAASGQTGSVEYKWESSTTSSSAGFADIASSNSATYTAGALTQTTWFKRLARVPCQTDWIGAVESNVIEVTVAPCNNPTVGGTIAAAQSGYNPFTPAAFTSSVAASGQTGTIEYKWESSTTSNSAGFSDIASSNAATYTPGALTVTTWFKRLARVSCKSDWTGAAESNVIEVTVTNCINPTIGGTIAAAQSGYNPFTPAAFTSSVAASGETGTIEYKWQSSTTSNSAGFADIASSNAATYTPGALTVTTWFKRLARVDCKSNWTGAAESNVLQVTVTPCVNPTIGGTIAAAQSGYNPFTPAAFTSSVAASGQTGTIEYKWQSSTTSNSAGFADIASSNAATYTPGALTVTTWFKRLARVSCKSDWTGAAESNVLEVTVVTLATQPIAQPTNLYFTNTGTSSPYNIVSNFTASTSAAGYIVVRKTGAAPSFVPVDGTSYSAGAQGSDEIVYVGNATYITDYAAPDAVDYNYAIYAYNGSGGSTNYLTTSPLTGKAINKSSKTESIGNTAQSTSAGFPTEGVNVNFPNGTTGSTISATKTNSAPASNFSVLPGVRGVVNQYFTITSSNANPGTYTLILDFSSLGLSTSSWSSFKILKRADATAPWVNITDLGATIANRQTDGVWGKFTITGLSSFSQFTGGAASSTITVTSAAETGAGSLKQAILDATDGDYINFNVSAMGSNTITLTSPMVINKDITIQGANGGLIIDGNNVTRVMEIADTKVVRLERLKIVNGNGNVGYAGGIWNNGNLTMVNCVVSGNKETGNLGVGGILQFSDTGDDPNDVLNLVNCTITANDGTSAVYDDGIGGLSVANGTAYLYNTIVYGNTGDGFGDIDQTSTITEIKNSCIGNLSSITYTTGSGNIATNPGFVGSIANATHPYAISNTSPAADAGDNAYSFDATDIRGGAFGRKINKTTGLSGTIDMGAYEFSGCVNPTVGGTIAAAQNGVTPFNPAAFTSTVAASGQSGTVEYKWQSSITNATTGFSDIASSNADTYDAGALTVTTWFKRLARVSCSADWTGAVESNVIEVTVVSLLPVTGIELGGTASDKQVKLSFKALNEREMASYTIERSADGLSFTNIGSLQASNANQASASYSFADNQPIVGNNYYRIKGSSINGQNQYSNVVVVKYGVNVSSVAVVPNPIEGKTLKLKVSQLAKGNYHINVIDALGRSIFQKEMLLDGSGLVQLNLPTSAKAGNYYVKVDRQGTVFVQAFIIR